MTSRQRLGAASEHKPTDKLCVDFGAGGQTGMGVCAVNRLRQAIFGDKIWRVKVIELYQMLGEIDEQLRKALGLDVVGVHPRKDMFGISHNEWKPFTMPIDGTEVLVPKDFNCTFDAKDDLLMHPEGDISVAPSAKMPRKPCRLERRKKYMKKSANESTFLPPTAVMSSTVSTISRVTCRPGTSWQCSRRLTMSENNKTGKSGWNKRKIPCL